MRMYQSHHIIILMGTGLLVVIVGTYAALHNNGLSLGGGYESMIVSYLVKVLYKSYNGQKLLEITSIGAVVTQ